MVAHRIDMYRFKWELDNIKAKKHLENPTIFYGSSTFAMFKDCEEYFKKYNAINCGFGGSTSDEALFHYEMIKEFKPKVLVFYFGDNEPVCGYTIDEVKELYETIFLKFKKDFPTIKIITLGTKCSPSRNEYKDFVKELNEFMTNLTKKYDYISYISTADLCFDQNGNYILSNYLADQLHFSSLAYDVLKVRIEEELKKCY